jgi:hypothetical protein
MYQSHSIGPRNASARRLLWLPLIMLGVIVTFLMARRDGQAKVISQQKSRPRTVPSRQRQLLRLRQAICGNEKWAIEQIFGPPPTVAGPQEAPTWYYPLDTAMRRAIVIEFDGDVARRAQFVDAPLLRRRAR